MHNSLKKIDNYYLDQGEILGKGSFSTVFKGVNVQNRKPVAIKTVQLSDSQAKLNIAKVEVSNLQLIDHENVVKLLDVKRSSNNLYLIMEFCNGGDLNQLLKRHQGRLTENEAMRLFKQIIEGMKALHENSMVHRDLKPANILIHEHQAKIADFGFSKLWDGDTLMTSYQGSPIYMSPQLLKRQPYSDKTDIWSLGIILYETLYGRPPWIVENMQSLAQEVVKNEIHFPEIPRVSHMVQELIKSMLRVEESQRLSWNEVFNHSLINQTHEDRFKQSLDSMSLIEDNDHLQKSKQLSKIYFEQNKICQRLRRLSKT